MEFKDYYKILGVDKKATDKDIKQAFRKLARKHHPDVNKGSKESEARFKEINEAYEVLGDAEKRKRYDELGANWKQYDQWQQQGGASRGRRYDSGNYGFNTGGGTQYEYQNLTEEDLQNLFGGGRGGGFSDFFHAFFEPGTETGGNYERRKGTVSRKGQTIEQQVEVTLEEASNGAVRLFEIADASGKTRRVEVKIPRGVEDGSKIRLAGQGGHGLGGGQNGDLYLITKIRPHKLYERKGADLYVSLPVPLTDSVLGGEIEVPTLNGKVMLKIPPETANGKVFRLKGKGMPLLGSLDTKGDLFVEINVVLPQRLSVKERELFKELAELRAA